MFHMPYRNDSRGRRRPHFYGSLDPYPDPAEAFLWAPVPQPIQSDAILEFMPKKHVWHGCWELMHTGTLVRLDPLGSSLFDMQGHRKQVSPVCGFLRQALPYVKRACHGRSNLNKAQQTLFGVSIVVAGPAEGHDKLKCDGSMKFDIGDT